MRKKLAIVMTLFLTALANGQEVSKDMWISQMKTALPQAFCSSEQYFRQCFNVQESQCKMVAADASNVCLQQYEGKIPSRLKLPADGANWGTQVGTCAGNAYEVALAQRKINTAKCNNPNNWK